jgi:hypothetical protein
MIVDIGVVVEQNLLVGGMFVEQILLAGGSLLVEGKLGRPCLVAGILLPSWAW